MHSLQVWIWLIETWYRHRCYINQILLQFPGLLLQFPGLLLQFPDTPAGLAVPLTVMVEVPVIENIMVLLAMHRHISPAAITPAIPATFFVPWVIRALWACYVIRKLPAICIRTIWRHKPIKIKHGLSTGCYKECLNMCIYPESQA